MIKNKLVVMSSDPEFGVADEHGLVPGILFLPPKHMSAYAASARGTYAAVNADVWNGEFQTNLEFARQDGGYRPTSCIAWMIDDYMAALRLANEIAVKHGNKLVAGDLLALSDKWIDQAPDEAWLSGCNPTWNVDTMSLAPVMPNFRDDLIQHGAPLGGHVHFIHWPRFDGVKRTDQERAMIAAEFIKVVNAVAVLPMLIWGWNEKRRERYNILGLGNFRMPRHGGIEAKDFGGSVLNTILHACAQFGFARNAFNVFESPEDTERILKICQWEELRNRVMSGDIEWMRMTYNMVGRYIRNNTGGADDECSPHSLSMYPNKYPNYVLMQFLMDHPEVLIGSVEQGWGYFKDEDEHNKGFQSIMWALLEGCSQHIQTPLALEAPKMFKSWIKEQNRFD